MERWFFITGYLVQLAGSILLLNKIWRRKSIYGLSTDTQICFLVCTLCRVVWSRKTALVVTYVAHAELTCSTLVSLALCFSVWKFRHTTTKQAWWPFKAYTLLPLAALLAILTNIRSALFSFPMLVTFTMYGEGIALVPQLYLMRRMIEVEPLTSHYVGLLILSRIVRVCFWVILYVKAQYFVSLFVADMLHTLLAADYLHLWCRKLRLGGSLVYKL